VTILTSKVCPSQPARDTSYFGSLDGQRSPLERLQYRLESTRSVYSDKGVIAASTPGKDFGIGAERIR